MQNLLLNLQLKGFNFVMGDGSGAWTKFGKTIDDFFHGSGGLYGQLSFIGWAVMIVGVVMMILSFAFHHFNQQSRMPSWWICLLIAIAGALLIKPDALFTWIQNIALWFEQLVS